MINQEKLDKIISFHNVYSEYLPQRFASLVSQSRKKRKISQKQMSEVLAVSQGWMSRLESGATRSIKDIETLVKLWDILELPDPDEIPNDILPTEILNLIKVLVRYGETMPSSAVDTLLGVAELVMRYGADPAINMPVVKTDLIQDRPYVPNEYSWNLRPLANYLHTHLHSKFHFERLTIERILKVSINGATQEIPETYTSGSVTPANVHYQKAIDTVYGSNALQYGGIFNTRALEAGIKGSVEEQKKLQNEGDSQTVSDTFFPSSYRWVEKEENAILIPVIRNKHQTERGANYIGEVKVFFYREKEFEYNDYVLARSVVGQFFIDVDQKADTTSRKNI